MRSYIFSFGELSFYDDHLVVTVAEGIHLTSNHIDEYLSICRNVFYGKPYIGISNRVNKYTIEASCYQMLHQESNLIGLAIVCKDKLQFYRAEAERSDIDFMNVMITDSLDDAVSWAQLEIQKYRH